VIQISERPGAHASPEEPAPPDRLRRALEWVAAAARRLPLSADDLVSVMVFAGLALVVTAGLWGTSATEANPRDHALFVFFFEHAAHAVTDLNNPFFTPLMGAPDGVNLMANTAFLGVTVPLVPATLIAGPAFAYGLAMMISLAGTATAWYVFVRRHLSPNRGIAFAAGALAGFSPGLVGHVNGHPNLAAQFMLPLIISAVIRLRTAANPVRSGVLLGLMIVYQFFINEELLFFTAIACLVMVAVFAVSQPQQALDDAVRFATGLGVAVGVAGVLLAYPLWFQFSGPQHYTGPFVWAPNWYLDVVAYPSYGNNSIAGWFGSGSRFNNDPDETNAYLGLPLMLLCVATAILLWRVLAVRVAAVVGLAFMIFSFGDKIRLQGADTGIEGPYKTLREFPIFDSVITSRLGLAVAPAAAVLVACAAHHVLGARPSSALAGRRRTVVWAVLAAVLVPLTPTTIKTVPPMPVPQFYSDGAWRRYVDDGSIVPVPPNLASEPTVRALVAADLGPRFIDGYYIGPTSPDWPIARFGPYPRPTVTLLQQVQETGQVPEITPEVRATALEDLRYWEADALVLVPGPNAEPLRLTVNALVGEPGVAADGVWVWDVRDLVS